MSGVNFLEKLLDGVGVEWTDLGDICKKISSGKNKEKCEDGQYPVFGSTGIIGRTNNKGYEKEQILIARVGANAGRVNIAEGEYDVSDNTLIIQNKENVILKYLYYYLVNINLNQFAQGAGQPLITAGQLKSIKIPIHCPENPKKSLEIQAEIVRILDAFTELTAELTAELNMRKKQYNYYRDQLLSFEEGEAEWKTLGEVYKFQYGTGNTIPTLGGEYPVYGSNGIVGTHNEFNSEDSPVIGHIGAYAGIVNWGAGKHFVTYNGVICKLINKLVHPKYAYYQLLKQDFNSMAKSASHPFVSYDALNKVSIPIPPPAEQARIVAILDKFDALTHSITEGLPREIALRQKQYAYYRDLLLSFPKAVPETPLESVEKQHG